MFNYECQPIYPCKNSYAHMIVNNSMLPYFFLHMYQCLQNRNEMFAGNDNDT